MAIRIERVGPRTVVAQTRRGLRIAVWSMVALAVVGMLTTVMESRRREHAVVRCDRSAGRCEVTRNDDHFRVIPLDSIRGVKVDADPEASDGWVGAVIVRSDGLPRQVLCEAKASAPEAAGIRDAAAKLVAFLADRDAAALEVACETSRPGTSPGAVAGRTAAQLGGVLLILFALVIFLVEIRTEIDPEAGLVRITGRSAFPPRRWSVERRIAEVAEVLMNRRGWGGRRWVGIHLRFSDDTTAAVLSPMSGWVTKADGWMTELRQALGLPPASGPA